MPEDVLSFRMRGSTAQSLLSVMHTAAQEEYCASVPTTVTPAPPNTGLPGVGQKKRPGPRHVATGVPSQHMSRP